jgi:hypothetical protein
MTSAVAEGRSFTSFVDVLPRATVTVDSSFAKPCRLVVTL